MATIAEGDLAGAPKASRFLLKEYAKQLLRFNSSRLAKPDPGLIKLDLRMGRNCLLRAEAVFVEQVATVLLDRPRRRRSPIIPTVAMARQGS